MLYELNSDELIRQQCEARRRAKIEEKRINDKLKQLAELMEEKEKWEHEKANWNNEKEGYITEIEELKNSWSRTIKNKLCMVN